MIDRGRMLRGAVWATLAWLGIALAAPALADPVPAPPVRSRVDENNVNLMSGQVLTMRSDIAIGPDDHRGLKFTRQWVGTGWRYADMPTISGSTSNPVVSWRGQSFGFTLVSGAYKPNFEDGSSLSAGRSQFTASDGTVISFAYTPAYFLMDVSLGYAVKITFPDSTVWNFDYQTNQYQYGPTLPPQCYVEPLDPVTAANCGALAAQWQTYTFQRLSSIRSSTGYQLKMAYAIDTIDYASNGEWQRLTKVTGINNAVEYCDPAANSCTLTNSWPSATYGSDGSYTDPAGRKTLYTFNTAGKLTSVKINGASTNLITYTYDANNKVASAQKGGQTWTYTYGAGTATVTDPLTKTRILAYNTTTLGVSSDTDELGKVTSFTYCGSSESNCPVGLLKTVSAPESNKVTYAYDARGNRTGVTYSAKTGSGLADITTSAAYPSSCTNTKTCNKPSSTTDALGKVTNYTYDATSGAVTSVKAPADAAGVRPETRYSYSDVYARYKNASGTVVQAATPVRVVTGVSSCRVGASCTGTAEERVVQIAYPSSGAHNAQASSVTTKAGNNTLSATTTLSYTDLGAIKTVDGPLSGSYDAARTYYDTAGRVTGEVGGDPDGTGSNPRLAKRYSYNSWGQVSAVETGRVADISDTAMSGFAADTKSVAGFDSYGRLITQAQVATSGTTQYSLAQTSYDSLGRAECKAQRMNAPLTTTSLPTSACTAMTAGSYGADRISKVIYDAVGRTSEVQSGVGTALVQATQKMGYTNNGRLSWVEDAESNRTTYLYDGHDRVVEVRYPNKTTKNASNSGDNELFTYDANGNLLTFQTRRDEVLTFTYDALGRPLTKVVPERSGLSSNHTRDVDYSYDLHGNLLKAMFDGSSTYGDSFSYDALGRIVTESTALLGNGTSSITNAYDVRGLRTSMTFPDGEAFLYEYDNIGRISKLIRQSFNTTLITYSYNANGTLAGMTTTGAAPDQTFGYDAALRPSQRNFTNGGSYNSQWTYSWNPAGQLTSDVRTNDLFAWDGHVTVNRSYADNGLNQYTQVAGTSFTYDANGNLTSDGANSYVYDVENRLVTTVQAGVTSNLYYSPLGRLSILIQSNAPTKRFFYDGDALVAEYNGDGSALLTRFVHGVGAGDDPLVAFDSSSTLTANLYYLYTDRLGSVIMSTRYDGTVTKTGSYDEYGIPGGANAGIGADGQGRFGYTGQMWLSEIGMNHYKARAYSPTLGRFMQTDPIGYSDGMNLYRYVMNDPVNGVDPTGLADVIVVQGDRIEPYCFGIMVGSSCMDPFQAMAQYGNIGMGSPIAPFPGGVSGGPGGSGPEIVVRGKAKGTAAPQKVEPKSPSLSCGNIVDIVAGTILITGAKTGLGAIPEGVEAAEFLRVIGIVSRFKVALMSTGVAAVGLAGGSIAYYYFRPQIIDAICGK